MPSLAPGIGKAAKLTASAASVLLLMLAAASQSAASLVVDRQIQYATGIDPTKSALLPGQTSSGANIVNAQGGITNVLIDVSGLPSSGGIGLGDLGFRVGNSTDIASWGALGTAPTVSTLIGGGDGGTDRISLSWSFNEVENTCLEITLAANASTGLASPDVFYFGHLQGDVNGDAAVTAIDVLLIANELNASGGSPIPADGPGDPLDVNRDGSITNFDVLLVNNAINVGVDPLVTISPPLPQPVPLPAAVWLFATAVLGIFTANRRRGSVSKRKLPAGTSCQGV